MPEQQADARYFIDLFSGGESWRRSVEARGFVAAIPRIVGHLEEREGGVVLKGDQCSARSRDQQ